MKPVRPVLAAALAAAFALPAAALPLGAGAASAAAPLAPGTRAQPVLGAADRDTVVMGAATAGTAGETWAFRRLATDVPLLADPAGTLAFGPGGDATSAVGQLLFLRTDDAAGGVWSPAQTPLDENGDPYRGPQPNAATARVTAHGGGALAGRDARRTSGSQAVVLARDPGGRFRALPAPPATVALPADDAARTPAETIAPGQGAGHVPIAAWDDGDRTHVLLALAGPDVERAVAHWDGSGWSREPIDALPGAPATFHVVALDAVSGRDAYLLARTDPASGDGLLLFRRVEQGGSVRWERQDLGPAAARFAAAATPADGVAAVAPLDGDGQQPLSATADGVWIDGTIRLDDGGESDLTVWWAAGPGRVAGSWCDASGPDGGALCDYGLGFRFGRRAGYRSFAFAGDGAGTRVVTNPLAPGGEETSNLGSWARFDGERFERQAGAGPNFAASGGFASADRGWLQGPVQVSAAPAPARFASWPVSLRAPLLSIASAPGATPGALDAAALAVGASGAVARYTPGDGWEREYLLTSTGAVSAPTLRGVAWPERGRAYAVGDLGAMWLWRAETGLWEKDAAAPIAFDGNLMGIAFDPSDPQRGYAVGRDGVLLAYGKTWEQQALPAGFAAADLTSIAFAGRQALVAAGSDVLADDGDGRGWHVEEGLRALLAKAPAAGRIVTVAGLPDGGAIAAGRGMVYVRDSAGGAWRPAAAPLPNASVVAAAAVREGDRVRAVVSIAPDVDWPVAPVLPPPDPDVPDPLVPVFPLAGDGYLLRETDGGWRDEERTAFAGVANDKPQKSDPIAALALDPAGGAGWAVGGWSGQADSAGRGTGSGGTGAIVRARVQTAAISRYAPDGAPTGPSGTTAGAIGLDTGAVTFAVAGHATCDAPCSLLAGGIGPDRAVSALNGALGALGGQPGAPRALLYTGGRLPVTSTVATPYADAARLAGLLAQAPLPVYGALSAADSLGGGAAVFRSAFAGLPAPFGTGALPAGVTPAGSADADLGTRTHYAFDSSGNGGTVRVIVIDNSRGSLAASDPYQVPHEPQEGWLRATLKDARARGIPAIVVGSRDLNTRFVPRSNLASDGDAVAQLLVEEGASAYLYERPEEQRVTQVPAGATQTIPQYGTGSLGYRSPIANAVGENQADAIFGDSGYLLVSVDAARRDPSTNRAPVRARMIPLITQLSLAAVDGTLLRRSRPALFQGLGRRPLGGDRWGPISPADGSPNPTGADPYLSFPAAICQQANCGTRITPEYRFTSSDPDIADFVAVDPGTTNLRKPLQGSDGKTVTDASSGLLCAFNAGTATLTVSAGGMSFSQQVTVQAGSVQQPCGTRPLRPDRIRTVPTPEGEPETPPGPAPAPAVAPSPAPAPPPPPPALARVLPRPPRARPQPPAYVPPVFVPGEVPLKAPDQRPIVGASPPPPATSFTSPTPPGGATVRVFEEKREEEVAPEQSSAFARYDPDEHVPLAPALLGLALLAAFSGTALTLGVRRRDRNRPRRVAPATANARARARADERLRPIRRSR
jgi:hypothetical protein